LVTDVLPFLRLHMRRWGYIRWSDESRYFAGFE
jgi:hypothetical protein